MDLNFGFLLAVLFLLALLYVGLWRALVALMKSRLGDPYFRLSRSGVLVLGIGLIVPLWPFSIAFGFILALRHEGFFRGRVVHQ